VGSFDPTVAEVGNSLDAVKVNRLEPWRIATSTDIGNMNWV